MDGLSAKRVLTALAKKLSFDSVRRCNYKNNITNGYCLKLVSKSTKQSMPLYVIYPNERYSRILAVRSSKWADFLKELEGKSLGIRYNNGMPIVIEQLVVDLELEGFLKNI